MEIFKCPVCNTTFSLPKCMNCTFTVNEENKVWQFTNAPDFVIEGDSDKYIGYEHIGEAYSGVGLYEDDDKNGISYLAEEAVKHSKNGIILDLCCGDGAVTVPLAKYGVKVIASDISNSMMLTALKRANYHGVSLDKVTFCRMNALSVDIANESVDVVICNSSLHLISSPEKVVQEIHRVLKNGGRFISIDDAPASSNRIKYFENKEYGRVINTLYNSYWGFLNKQGVYAKKLSWKFDKNGVCISIFGENSKQVKTIHRDKEHTEKIEDYQLPRFKNRGFSDQTSVPEELHKEAFDFAVGEIVKLCGEDYGKAEMRYAENDIEVVSYIK